MTKDPIVESHIAQSKAKIEKAAPDTVTAERHIDRTQMALERSRELLNDLRDPFQLAAATGDAVIGGAERPLTEKTRFAQGEGQAPARIRKARPAAGRPARNRY